MSRCRILYECPEQRGAEQIENAEADKERGVSHAGHKTADRERKEEQAEVAEHASHSGRGCDFTTREKVRGHRDHRDRQGLMRKAGQTEERESSVGALHGSYESDATHDERSERECRASGVDQSEPTPLELAAQKATEDASDIRREKRQPCRERDLFQIEMSDRGEVKRQPKGERAPGRIREKTGQGDA